MDQAEQQPERRDVSRQTLVVLVVLAVVVSLLGTFTVLRETNGVHQVKYAGSSANAGSQSAEGKIVLSIANSNSPAIENSEKTKATGYVALYINS
ncbi:MAG: hypothetical protein ACP5N2_00470 [Candidatus Nanoarchaeia archaeon]